MPDEDELAGLATDVEGDEPPQDDKAKGTPPAQAGAQPDDDGDEDADGGPDEVEEPARRPGRREARIQALSEAQRAEKDRADRLERQLEEIRAEQGRSSQRRQESPEEESARLALMSPEERSDYKLDKALRQVATMSQQAQFTAAEVADRTAFETKAASDTLYAKMAPAVEKTLKELRAQGQNVPRQVLFELEVGRAALAARGKTKGAKDKGAANLRRETTAPLNGKGDQTAARRKSGDTPAKRLADVQI